MLTNVYKSENIKLHRSLIFWIHVAVAVVLPIIIAIYVGTHVGSFGKLKVMNNFYPVIAIATLLMISIIISLVFDREHNAGNFKNILSQPYSKHAVLQAQTLYFTSWYFLEMIFMSALYYLCLLLFHINLPSIMAFLSISIMFSILSFCQYELTQIVAYRFGVGGAIILGFVGTLLALMGNYGMFDRIWYLIPWVWQPRLAAFWMPGILNTSKQFWGYLLMYLPAILITAIIYFLANQYIDRWQKNI